MLFISIKLVVSHSLRKEKVTIIHKTYFVIHKCKRRGCEILFWPGIANDIEQLISKCHICEKFRKQNSQEPLMPHLIPNKPFERISLDILQFVNQNYLAIIYYYSKWVEISILKDKTANEIMGKLKCIFDRHDIPFWLHVIIILIIVIHLRNLQRTGILK